MSVTLNFRFFAAPENSGIRPMERNVKLFSGTATHYLAERIALGYGLPLGEGMLPASAMANSPSFDESVRGCDDVYYPVDFRSIR